MTPILKHTMVACMSAAFAIALAAPSQAQQNNVRQHAAASQQVYTPYEAARDRDMAVEEGYDAYAYVPLQSPDDWEGCATRGTNGPIDPANCY